MDRDLLKKIYIGTSTTTVALASIATLGNTGFAIKCGLLVLVCAVQYEFYRRLAQST